MRKPTLQLTAEGNSDTGFQMATEEDPQRTPSTQKIAVDKLTLGTSMRHITVRLMRLWEARNFKKNGELLSLDMALLDDKDCLIQASIHNRRVRIFKNLLEEGKVYQISNFEVVQAYARYKVTDNEKTIRFTDATTILEVKSDNSKIKKEFFRLLSYTSYVDLANTNLQLPDVVGQIISIGGTNVQDTTSTEKLVIQLLLEGGTTVRLTAWDNQATEFRQHLQLQGRQTMVVVCTCVNPKLFAGTLYLNTTGATKFYFGDAMNTIREFKARVSLDNETIYPKIENAETKVNDMETMTLKELLKYINSPTRQKKEIKCIATISAISSRNGWNFVSCGRCSKKVIRGQTSFTCENCNNTNAVGVLKFRVDLVVSDDEETTNFVIFDDETRKLTNRKAEDIATLQAAGNIPQCIHELVGRTLEFQIKLTQFNFDSNYQSFTVTRVIREIQTPCKEPSRTLEEHQTAGQASDGGKLYTQIATAAKPEDEGLVHIETAKEIQANKEPTTTVYKDLGQRSGRKRKQKEIIEEDT